MLVGQGWRRAALGARLWPVVRPFVLRSRACLLALALGASCQSPSSELTGLADRPPLDYSVLVTGGAFLQAMPQATGATFGAPTGVGANEAVAIGEILSTLERGVVFRRIAVDDDEHRRVVLDQFRARQAAPELQAFLERARDQGYDLLLVVEQIQDSPIEKQGINGRWPVTLLTWLLLGIGVFIPDHTFESSATLRVTVRDLQTGAALVDSLSSAGPVDLSLVERSDVWGVLMSIVVPPFWVGDEDARTAAAVRRFSERRLLLSLARELKSEPTRQRLRERLAAAITALPGKVLAVESGESLAAVRLRRLDGGAPIPDAAVADFERRLVASRQPAERGFRYEAPLPAEVGDGLLQVLVVTLRGSVASATVQPGAAR